METTQNGSKSSKSTTIVASSSAPWLDLPDGIADLILERLCLRDYMQFAIVCRKWRSIQRDHRLRHSPGAPPMALPLPWILHHLSDDGNDMMYFLLPNSTLNLFPLPSTSDVVFPPFRGWLFVLTKVPPSSSEESAYLLNPVSGVRVQLPALSSSGRFPCAGVLSASPTDPDCVSLIIDWYDESIWVCRVHGQGEWIKLPTSHVIPDLDGPFYGDNAIFCGGKFYCFCSGHFIVIDPLFPCPSMKILEMDYPSKHTWVARSHYLVASNGEVLMVLGDGTNMSCDTIQDFQVFRADFSLMKWVMVEELGDRVLFVDDDFAFCLSAAEVGCKKNLIYYTSGRHIGVGLRPPLPAWRVFDMDARGWTDGPSFPVEVGVPSSAFWFVPSLEYVYPL